MCCISIAQNVLMLTIRYLYSKPFKQGFPSILLLVSYDLYIVWLPPVPVMGKMGRLLTATKQHIDGLSQDCRISIANALEKLQFCHKSSI